jgi:hypothetical protein
LFHNERQLVGKVCRAGRKGTVQRRRADGKTGRSGLDDGRNPLGPIDGACHHHRLRGDRPTDPADQIRYVSSEAIGEEVEAVHTPIAASRQALSTIASVVPARALGWPTISPGKG